MGKPQVLTPSTVKGLKGQGKAGKGQTKAQGKGAGQWVWMPEAAPAKAPASWKGGGVQNWALKTQAPVRGKGSVAPFLKEKGGAAFVKGKAGVAPAKGKGGVKGGKAPISKYEEKLRTTDASLKVWVGGLAEGTNWKALEKHFAAVKKPVVTEIMKKGTAVLAYDTVEDVELAIASFNGSDLDGQALEVDVWIQKPKREDAVPRQKVKKVMPVKVMPVRQVVIKTALKGKPTDEANRKMKEKLAAFDHALKVWVGGLPANTAWKALNEHLATVAKPKLTHVMNKGTACVVFESSDDVAIVIASLNASEFNGNTIELDVWTKPERKEKVAKVKAEE
eukprot:CAMPEP_0115085698 /NCGR_PEP_ID=MMETSP0227-20121206/22101_1 /TAXON_ID=89957 /ORGANISM="Polarella glacialis, Strain CCMP 1383" /LENGTH=334 /DNA_ID=CAMNT_0002474927 /DNA_START=78 /DNA_END=1082 /DNA_ORIENTATION=-